MKKEAKQRLETAPVFSMQSIKFFLIGVAINSSEKILKSLQLISDLIEKMGFRAYNNSLREGIVSHERKSLTPAEIISFDHLLDELEKNLAEAQKEQLRTFTSENEVIEKLVKEKLIPAKLLKMMLGGKWPDHEFNFSAVDIYRVVDGELVPLAWIGETPEEDDLAPGPDFKIVMCNDPLKP